MHNELNLGFQTANLIGCVHVLELCNVLISSGGQGLIEATLFLKEIFKTKCMVLRKKPTSVALMAKKSSFSKPYQAQTF